MLTLEQIGACAAAARDYPDLAARLRGLGVHSYTVDVASHATLYRSMDGDVVLGPGRPSAQAVAPAFSADGLAAAIERNRRQQSDYAGFMHDIAAAGVRRYEAVLAGARPRCIYFGGEGCVEEPIPL